MPFYHDEKTDTHYFKINYKDENGQYKQLLRRGFKSIKEVKAAMAKAETEINEGKFVKESKVLYEDYMKDWLEDKKRNIKKGTWVVYSNLVNNHILPIRENEAGKKVGLSGYTLGKIKARHIKDLLHYLHDNHSLSDENIQKCYGIIKDSLKAARTEGLVSDNQAELVKRPTARKKEMQVWTMEQAQQFLKGATSDQLYTVFLLALTAGMRQGELLGLRKKDVDKESNIISVTQILTHDGKGFDFGAKTLSGVRPIRLDSETMAALQRHIMKSKQKQMEYADVFEDNGLVFCTKTGKPISPRNVNRSFERIVNTINEELQRKRDMGMDVGPDLPKIRFHDLRHTHVTFLIKNRETPQAIAERLGWSDTRMIDNYAHIRPDIQMDVAETFGRSFYSTN